MDSVKLIPQELARNVSVCVVLHLYNKPTCCCLTHVLAVYHVDELIAPITFCYYCCLCRSTVCAGLLEMQRDLAILHDVGPQARSAKKRMATDESGKAIDIAYLETEDSVVEQDEKTTTQTEQQPISSLGGLLSNNGKDFRTILQAAQISPAGCCHMF